MAAFTLQALKDELTNDPLVRGYASKSNELCADSLNSILDRPADGSVKSMLDYLLVNKNRTNTGTDTTVTSMLGRLVVLANAAVGTDAFGSGSNVTLDAKCSALAMLEVCRNGNYERLPYYASTMQTILSDAVTAGVMKAADRTAIIALSNNLQSRAMELWSTFVTPKQVEQARAL